VNRELGREWVDRQWEREWVDGEWEREWVDGEWEREWEVEYTRVCVCIRVLIPLCLCEEKWIESMKESAERGGGREEGRRWKGLL